MYSWVKKLMCLLFVFSIVFVTGLSLAFAEPELTEHAAMTSKAEPMQLQKALAQAGFYKGNIDGIIGPRTKQAVRDFQAANGLAVDGICGPRTWEKLQSYLLGQTGTGSTVSSQTEDDLTIPSAEALSSGSSETPGASGDNLNQKLVQ